MWNNSAAPNGFSKVVMVTNHTEILGNTECLADTFWMLLTKFPSMAFSAQTQLSVLSQADLATPAKFLQPQSDYSVQWSTTPFTFYTTNFWGCIPWHYGPVQTCNAQVHKINFVALSSEWLSNHIQNEAMHNLPVHQLPQ